MKTPKQQLLEIQQNKDIRDIVLDTLERHRATRHRIDACAAELGVSRGAIYMWANDLEIDISRFRFNPGQTP